MAPPLLGPPELRNPDLKKRAASPALASDPFVDLMMANFNNVSTSSPPRGYTENGGVTLLSAGNPCLDFFFSVVPNMAATDVKERLQAAWDHDPLTSLKLICNLRGVRGTGKSDKHGFYTAALWLHGTHPKTLAANLESFANFGYLKDFPEILYELLEGAEVRQIRKREWLERKVGLKNRAIGKSGPFARKRSKIPRHARDGKKNFKTKSKPAASRELRIANAERRNKVEKERASKERKQKKISIAKKGVTRYKHDPDYRFLYERVSDLFADYLRRDMELLKSNQVRKVSLAAKWCPSIDSSFDRATLLCESIARKMFPRESYTVYEGIEEAHYAYRVRDRLRKEVLVPLRKVLELPEVYIGANDWGSIPYNRVASVAMNFYKEKFLKHDGERFSQYLKDVEAGRAKMAAGALFPHDIIKALEDDDGGQVAELQWKRMLDDMLQKGKLKSCMAVCDVSGSMTGTPMEVSVALGVLVSELSEEPWKGKLISFSENPQLHHVVGDDLRARTEFVRNMDWGCNTDFQRVFDLILKIAVEGSLKPEQMMKRLFVFSDMEFDQASCRPWETDYEAIVGKYREKGFGDVVPQIVFWNLRSSRSTPVHQTQKGTALVSGFSKNLIKIFLDNDGEINPILMMEAAISGDEYKNLVVVD